MCIIVLKPRVICIPEVFYTLTHPLTSMYVHTHTLFRWCHGSLTTSCTDLVRTLWPHPLCLWHTSHYVLIHPSSLPWTPRWTARWGTLGGKLSSCVYLHLKLLSFACNSQYTPLYTSQYTLCIPQTVLRTDDMDLAGDVIQSLAAYLGIEVGSYPKLVLRFFTLSMLIIPLLHTCTVCMCDPPTRVFLWSWSPCL